MIPSVHVSEDNREEREGQLKQNGGDGREKHFRGTRIANVICRLSGRRRSQASENEDKVR